MTLVPLFIGASVVYTARFVPRKLLQLIRTHRPDIFMAVPSMYHALLSLKSASAEDFRSLRLVASGGEPLARSVFEQFRDRFGLEIREGYGLTETSPIASINTLREWRVGSVGKPIPQCRVDILDDQGHMLPTGQVGEVAIAGPNVMAGYHNRPELTAEVIDEEGRFRTGDCGRLDEDGFLYITGRKKDMLIIGGENVYPREIEEVLNQHPSLKDAAVVGKADPSRGEVPVAYVELFDGAQFDEADIRQFCRSYLPGYKVPREVQHVDQLPRSPIGKVLRRELRS